MGMLISGNTLMLFMQITHFGHFFFFSHLSSGTTDALAEGKHHPNTPLWVFG